MFGRGGSLQGSEPALGAAAAAGREQLRCGAVTAATRRCGQLDRPWRDTSLGAVLLHNKGSTAQ